MSGEGRTFLLTGGTGFLGSHIGVELLKRGHRVIFLVRPKGGLSAEERVDRLLDWFDLDARDKVEVAEGYLDQPGLGMDPQHRRNISDRVEEVVHCGADTSFSARKAETVQAINVGSVRTLFGAIRGGACRKFHHMSTTYVFGKNEGLCLEELSQAKHFHNEYERSKQQAEWEITSLCREAGVVLSLYRPSIVYGDSQSGHALSFNALYYPIRILLLVKEMLERDIREKGGQRAQEMGVSLLPDGKMRMPIRVGINGGGSIDLIPIDHLVRCVLAIMDRGDSAGLYHIVNPNKLTLKDLIRMIQGTYPITGIETVPEEEVRGARRNPLETLIDSYTEVYQPYLNDLRAFDDSRTKPILESAGLACPPLTPERFRTCMGYAQEMQWGNRLRF